MSENHGEFCAVTQEWYGFNVNVICTHRGVSARIHYDENDSPAEGPEFEFEGCIMNVTDENETVLRQKNLTWKQLVEMVGEKRAEEMLQFTEECAAASDEFGPERRRHNQHWPR